MNAGVSSTFSLPLIVPSLDRKESASLYIQTVQALDDMLQALIMDGVYPNMALLQRVLEVRGCGNQGNQSLGVPAMSGGKEGILAEHGCHSSPKPRFSDLGVCDNNLETNSCISLCH